MAQLAPPPSVEQDINSRQFRDWFYSIYALIGKPGSTLGTMAYENSNSVAITGGAIGGVGISGSTINSTPIGSATPTTGKFTTLEATASLKTDTLTGYLYGNGSGSNVSASTTIPSGSITGLGTMATQNANAVAITGGTINGTTIGATTATTGKFTDLQTTGTNTLGTLNGYLKGTTGVVSASSTIPYTDITGTPTGVSATITTAKLTTLGANGSMTFTNGILTSQTQAT
jgi:hypothetical protein